MTENEREISKAVQSIIDTLIEFDNDSKSRVLNTVNTFFGIRSNSGKSSDLQASQSSGVQRMPFSNRQETPPKEFLFQKQPSTDIEKVACLAYYLTHYRETPHFKTEDISKLNTEAAQIKFSNAAFAVANAASAGLLVQAGKGNKQISATGERFVEALPDKVAAKQVILKLRGRRKNK